MSSPQSPPHSSGNQTCTTGTDGNSQLSATSEAYGSNLEASDDEEKLWAGIASSLREISMNNKKSGKPNSQSLIRSQIIAECQALDQKHDWESDVPQPERAEIREAVDRAQKHCDKAPQDEAVGRLVFAIFFVLWGSFVNVELEDLDMKHLVLCMAKPASPDNALAPSVA